ncbi:MAG: sulfite exporter TauE/SafE family protein [Alphaproteobacteria bacterium]|nr:sulfite exporter TauE/SafE family protein [Alphaproteobacteria bacterium]
MNFSEIYLPLILLMLATGLIGGVLAGLMGIGGGIVIVPVLDFALGFIGVDADVRMHVAVATSLATIIPTSLSSSRAHYRRGAVDFSLVRQWGPAIFAGAALGSWIAARVDSSALAAIFAGVALLVAIKMILPLEKIQLADRVPGGASGVICPGIIGVISTMMGIGGGALNVTALTIFNVPIHRAVGTSAFFGLLIAVPGTIGFMITGIGHPLLPPGSVGFVNVIGFAILSPATFVAAPFGARIAHALSQRQLSMIFGGFLLIVAVRMLYRIFMP